MKKAILIGIAVLSLTATIAAQSKLRPPLWEDDDDRPVPQPKERDVSDLYAIVYNSWLRHLNPKTALPGKPVLNVNAWDEAPNSSWFTNRIGIRPITFDEILNGLEGKPPEPFPWRVINRNDSGYTPKVNIEDSSRRRYVLKFDPPGARERNSGAERIGTLIMYAAGYNVPHNTITYFRPDDLALDAQSYYRDPMGKRQQLTREYLNAALERLDPMPDGRYRGIASLYLPGAPLGPFVFTGRRPDDPNDIIPHELRREIRGMGVIASWINHVDIKDHQALDVYYTAPNGDKFVKHYMLDFSATLGAYEWPSAPYRLGHEYMFDGAVMAKSLFSLGLWQRPWEVHGEIPYQEVGYFPAKLFEPDQWKPSFPNLAFEQMDDSDAYWGAKIVTAFTDEMIRKLAEAGEFRREEVTRYIEDVLKQRRNAIGKYWLNRVTPLEEIILIDSDGSGRVQFRDLATERGYADANARRYRYWFENLKGKKLTAEQSAEIAGRSFPLRGLRELRPKVKEESTDRHGRTPLIRLMIQSNQTAGKWALPIEVFLGHTKTDQRLQVLGWKHAPR